MVLSGLRNATGNSKPIFAIPMRLNANLSGVASEIHGAYWDHGPLATSIGQQYTHRVPFTGRDPFALQRRY